MLSISPELQKQIELNARYEGVSPEQYDISPEELEELKEFFKRAEENLKNGMYYTREEVFDYVAEKLVGVAQK